MLIYGIALFILSLTITILITPYFIKTMRKVGIVGIDIHKKDKPKVAEMGGIPMVISLILSSIVGAILFPDIIDLILSFTGIIVLVSIIGIVDYFKTLSAKTKPLLVALCGLPLYLSDLIVPRPVFPIIGRTRLTVVYMLAIPLGLSVTSNAANMIDVLNGSLTGSLIPILISTIVISIIMDSETGIILSLIVLGLDIAMYYYNRYPSKLFLSDVGSLSLGAAIGLIAILGHIEVPTMITILPYIMNSFHSLASIGKLFERHSMKERPTIVMKNGLIDSNPSPKAPLTLTRMILAEKPLNEREIVKEMIKLTSFSSVLGILTAFLCQIKI
ncbi:MAG: hypothetical protein ACTSR0_03385 [Candidatus Asgardarchaeia archaeon]